ncbi:MAG: hypothetical protein M3Y59_06810 [Myxococcota bacterium]|nr:hypothetical protein [Myxococcota bacterium]
MSYVLSKHHQTLTSGEVFLIYNALTPRPLRGSKSLSKVLAAFEKPAEAEPLIAANPRVAKVIQTLADKQVIVPPDVDERLRWVQQMAGEHLRAPRQAVIELSGMGLTGLKEALGALEEVVAGSEGPFSLVFKGMETREDWDALVGLLGWGAASFGRFDWLQHFVVTDGSGLSDELIGSFKGYNLAFRLEGAADPKTLTARLLTQGHRALVSVPLGPDTTSADLIAIGAKALYLQPTEELLRNVSTDDLVVRIKLLRKELTAQQISTYGVWDHVIFGYSKRRVPRPLIAALLINKAGVSVNGQEPITLGSTAKGKVAAAAGTVPLPPVPTGCERCPVLGLCYGQARGAQGPGSRLCNLIVAEWNDYLISFTFPNSQPQQVAAAAAFG